MASPSNTVVVAGSGGGLASSFVLIAGGVTLIWLVATGKFSNVLANIQKASQPLPNNTPPPSGPVPTVAGGTSADPFNVRSGQALPNNYSYFYDPQTGDIKGSLLGGIPPYDDTGNLTSDIFGLQNGFGVP
jgi:hypothetical protein